MQTYYCKQTNFDNETESHDITVIICHMQMVKEKNNLIKQHASYLRQAKKQWESKHVAGVLLAVATPSSEMTITNL